MLHKFFTAANRKYLHTKLMCVALHILLIYSTGNVYSSTVCSVTQV